MESVLIGVQQTDIIWHHSHRPIYFSIASSIPAFESECFYVNDDLDARSPDASGCQIMHTGMPVVALIISSTPIHLTNRLR